MRNLHTQLSPRAPVETRQVIDTTGVRRLARSAVRLLRLPLLPAVLPAALPDLLDQIEDQWPRTEVFFADAAGAETAAAEATRVEVVTDGPGGEPVILAFTRMALAVAERSAA